MLKEYIRTRVIYYLGLLFITIILLLLQSIFNLELKTIILIILTSFMTMTILFIISFVSLQLNFKKVKSKLDKIENPEFISYYLTRPKHYESGYLYDMLDIIARSLYHRHKQKVDEQIEFQEYLLMFVHDLKLPIQNLKLVADETSQVEVKKLEELTDNLLNYSKISFKNIDLNITQIDVKDVINEIIKNNFDLIIDKQIKLNYSSVNYYLTTDLQWLSFILRQLINNALKYCDSYIAINFEHDQDKFKILIENDGGAIQSDEIASIFDKGYTGSNANNQSTGYGLYYVKKVADILACEIEVEIEEHTKFIVVFNNIEIESKNY